MKSILRRREPCLLGDGEKRGRRWRWAIGEGGAEDGCKEAVAQMEEYKSNQRGMQSRLKQPPLAELVEGDKPLPLGPSLEPNRRQPGQPISSSSISSDCTSLGATCLAAGRSPLLGVRSSFARLRRR